MGITIKTNMINREIYIDQIKAFINKPIIKVISGIRRSGKSVLLMLIKKELIKTGVKEENILYINFESFEYSDINNAKLFYRYIKNKIKTGERYYILIDEIQEVESWEKAINSFQVDFNVDIYVTGSNSHLLSSELATYLSGRYVHFTIYTLSFKEYLLFRKEYSGTKVNDIYTEFENYLRLGGFPLIHTGTYSKEQA